jgi:antitoxin ParD1/3/4
VIVMPRNTSITLGSHFEDFVAAQLESGRYRSASEVIRAGLRLLEDSETRMHTLRHLLAEGEESGFADYSLEALLDEMDRDSGR